MVALVIDLAASKHSETNYSKAISTATHSDSMQASKLILLASKTVDSDNYQII